MGSSHETGNLSGDERRACAKALEGGRERGVAFVRCAEKRVMGGLLFRLLPHPLDGIELRGVRGSRKSSRRRPFATSHARPSASRLWHGLLSMTRNTFRRVRRTSHLRKSRNVWALKTAANWYWKRGRPSSDSAPKMCAVFRMPNVSTRGLHADPGPRLVQCPIEPEAGLVLVHDYAAAGGRFFLMRGSFSRSHTAWASASARARRRRGRCTEKPRSWSRRGTWWLWYRTPNRCAIRSPIMGPVRRRWYIRRRSPPPRSAWSVRRVGRYSASESAPAESRSPILPRRVRRTIAATG